MSSYKTIGMREFNQNVSKIVREVEAGEEFHLIDRGKPTGVVLRREGSDGPLRKWVTAQDLNRALALAPIVDESWIEEYQRHRAQEHDPLVDPWDDQR